MQRRFSRPSAETEDIWGVLVCEYTTVCDDNSDSVKFQVTVTECALLLVLNQQADLPLSTCRGFRVLTPVAAFGSMLTKRLIDSGFYEIMTEILD